LARHLGEAKAIRDCYLRFESHFPNISPYLRFIWSWLQQPVVSRYTTLSRVIQLINKPNKNKLNSVGIFIFRKYCLIKEVLWRRYQACRNT
jgi:hypothetical protein